MSTIRATYVQHGSSAVPNITLNASGQVIVASGIVSSGTFAAPSGSVSAPGIYFNGDSNTGLYSPAADTIAFTEGGVEALRIDSSGRVGIGTSNVNAPLEVNKAASGLTEIVRLGGTASATNDGWKLSFYQSTVGEKGYIGSFYDGSAWQTVTNGDIQTIRTGGTERVRVDSSGRVGIGSSTPVELLSLYKDNNPYIAIQNSATGTTSSDGGYVGMAGTEMQIYNKENAALSFWTNSTQRAQIDGSGRLLVGTSSARGGFFGDGSVVPNIQLEVSGSRSRQAWITNTNDGQAPEIIIAKSRGTSNGGVTVVQNNDELGMFSFQGTDGTDFTEAARIQAFVDGTPGNNDMPGRLVFSTTADGASSPTERMRIQNNGDTHIGRTNNTRTTTGLSFESFFGVLGVTSSTNRVMDINRQGDDGDLILFFQANTQEGSISVSGTTVSYNGAHLSRWSQIPGIDPHDKTDRPEILRGTVMSNLDEMCDWIDPESGDAQDNEQLNKTKISDVEGDKNVAGIFQAWDDDDDTWMNDYYLAMTGDFIIRIGAGVTVERGDLLMSAGDGTAKPQDDDIIRSKTIAKVTSTNVSCTYDDGSYCVPCVLMAC